MPREGGESLKTVDRVRIDAVKVAEVRWKRTEEARGTEVRPREG